MLAKDPIVTPLHKHRHTHSAELGGPRVERRRADADLTAKVGNTFAAFVAFEQHHHLAIGETGLLDPKPPPYRENSTSDSSGFQGGLPSDFKRG